MSTYITGLDLLIPLFNSLESEALGRVRQWSTGIPIGIYTTFHGPPSDNDLSVFPLSSALTFDCLNATINWS